MFPMTNEFAPVYLNDVPVTLMGDEARPPLSRIVQASGQRPEDVQVRWLKSASDPTGPLVQPDDIVDRTAEPTKPIYLWSTPAPARSTKTAARAGDRIIAQLGRPPIVADPLQAPEMPDEPEVRPILFRGAKRAEAAAAAEAEAEQRQEDQREAQDILQDEQEDLDHEYEDGSGD